MVKSQKEKKPRYLTENPNQSPQLSSICAVNAAAHEGNPVWSFSMVSEQFSAKISPPSVGRRSCRECSSGMVFKMIHLSLSAISAV